MDLDTGYLICSHGSRDQAAMREFSRLVRGLAKRLPFGAVGSGSLEFVQPTIRDGLAALRAKGYRRIAVIPAMMYGGAHVKFDIPAILTSQRDRYPACELVQAPDLSSDASLIAAATDSIGEALAEADASQGHIKLAETALLLVGSGGGDAASNAETARAARLLWEQFGIAHAEIAFAGSARPSVSEALTRLAGQGFSRIVVLPYLLTPGILAGRVENATNEIAGDFRNIQFALAGTLARHSVILDALEGRAWEASQSFSNPVSATFGLGTLPPGWRIANRHAEAKVKAALVAGDPLSLTVDSGDTSWLSVGGLRLDSQAQIGITVSYRPQIPNPNRLVFHPPVLALGLDCRNDTPVETLHSMVGEMLKQEGLAGESLAVILAPSDRAGAPGLHSLTAKLEIPVRFFDRSAGGEHRADGVFAEWAARQGAGFDARLVGRQFEMVEAACAIALGPEIAPATVGRPRGRIAILGTGLSSIEGQTLVGIDRMTKVRHVVGYGPNLDILGNPADLFTRHEYPLGEEIRACRRAVELAARGQEVALITGGEAGFDAMSAMVWDLIADADGPLTQIAIELIPAVSQMQAAAATAGAPLAQDFCVISLGDPSSLWKQIEARLIAAAKADFAIVLTHLVVRKRKNALALAAKILLRERGADTPIIVATPDGSATQTRSEVIRLADLANADIGAQSLLIVAGPNSRTVFFDGAPRVFTPRGYGAIPTEETVG